MYTAVLMAAIVTTSTSQAWCHRSACHGCYGGYSCYAGYAGYSGYSCYSGYAGYSGYACHGCYGCHGCHGAVVTRGFGAAGGCYGYHGGCYGAFGYNYAESVVYSQGCYGCHGGHSGYGVPLPEGVKAPVDKKPAVDRFPFIEPKKDGGAEEIPVKEKKKAKLHIEVPEGGKLFVDGQHIAVPAGARVFQTPALAPGQTYYYDIRIEVERNGRTRGEEQRVLIEPGIDAYVNFPTLRPATLASQNR